jgi:uncharacterized protein YbaR (Trm112 family)
MLPEITHEFSIGETKPKLASPQLSQNQPLPHSFAFPESGATQLQQIQHLAHSCENTRGVYPLSPSFASQLDSTSPPLLQSTFDTGAFMPIPKDLLDILVCPECKTPLQQLTDAASGLQCQTCRRIYPVRDDIPVLIIDQATKAPD